jgi:hypothetical protein
MSYEEEHGSLEVPHPARVENHERWLPCVFEDGKKLKVQIIPPTR